MRPTLRTTCLLAVALSSAALRAQVDPGLAERIRREGFENSQVMQILDELTNGIGHRLTGSDSFTAACNWGKAKFESFGIEHVELEKWGTWPVVWNRGQWSGRVVEPVELELQVATEAWTAGTKGRMRGRLLGLPGGPEELDALRAHEALAGAWLFGAMPRRGEFADALRAFLDEAPIAGTVYSSSGDAAYPTRMRVFGSLPRGELPARPEVMVRKDQADRLRELLAGEAPVVIEFDIRNRFRKEPIDLHNVIAEIRGSELPHEVVVVCGHLDSWHQATGTTDNGTGSASTLEAARILAAVGATPKRTIRFCLWGGEEQGLLGSREHTTMRRTALDDVSAVFNHDTGTNWAQSLTVAESHYDDMSKVFAPVMALEPPDADFDGPVFALNKTERLGGGGGSDHASFLRAGVPAFAWGLKGRSDYFRYTWHSQWDTYDTAIPEYMRHTSTVVALAALGTANLPNKLSREGVDRARGTDLKPVVEGILGVELGGEGDMSIGTVEANAAGAKIGLLKGDRIVAVDGEDVASLMELRRGLRGREGERTLTVQRGEQRVVLPIPSDALPQRRRGGE